MANNVSNLIGQRFGRLVVTGDGGRNKNNKTMVTCKCDCGNTHTTVAYYLKKGDTKSCGCLGREHQKNFVKRYTKHGMCGTPEHNAWKAIQTRCYNPDSDYYHLYGGKGIKVCERWLESFENFYEDMGPRPSDCTSIERIDSNKDYSPENCRWANWTEQSYNTSQNVHLTINGETKCVTEWAKVSPVTAATIRHRMKQGWEPYDCVFKELLNKGGNRPKVFVEYKGVKYSVPEICKKFDIGKTTFQRWLNRNMPVEEIVDKYRRK